MNTIYAQAFLVRLVAVICVLEILPFSLEADILINEFVADNGTTLQDEDSAYSDWIEIKNTSQIVVNLSGWYLTDKASDLTKWEFPSVSVQPGGYLIVFASSKNRAVAGSELHTNFSLSKNGEYLAIVRPDGSTIEHEYLPSFPAQLENVSYGLAGSVTKVTLVDGEAACSAHVPTNGSLGNTWHFAGFNDNNWDSGTTGVGYDEATTYDSLINLDVEADMLDKNASAYIRVPFTVTNISDIVGMELKMKYDDGFIAYINGVQVASKNPPSSVLAYNSTAGAQNADSAAVVFEEFDILASSSALVVGENILAIQALNRKTDSSDMLIVPELTYTFKDPSGTTMAGYLESPTPNAENTVEQMGVAAAVAISAKTGVYTTLFSVSLTSTSPVIYYTLDGSDPTTSSSQYTGPITINSTTNLRARSSELSLSLGDITSESYMFINADVASFSSNLPIIVVDNLGNGDISNTDSEPSQLSFFEPGPDGRTFLQDDFTLGSRAGIRRRGETSLRDTDNKPNLAIEAWGANEDDDSNIAPLGMPAESDWVLWAPYSRDLSGLRNAFVYNLSNQTGNYAVRTRFVEVFLNISGGNVSMADYAGLYVFMEKIRRDNDRVDVEALTSNDNAQPNVEGGYILRIDKTDPGQNKLSGMTQPNMYAVYPSPEKITSQQETYITNYIIDFEAQLSNPDPITGYPSFIDIDSFVDHNMFNMLTKNADGLHFSTYMSKTRGGKLKMGPFWDFDRSIDSAIDSRDNDTDGWNGGSSIYIDYDSGKHWWGLLFENADFWQAYVDRWHELRLDLFSDANIAATIDGLAVEVAEARVRDIAKWGFSMRSGGNGLDGTQQGEVNYMKWWLASRMDWIDGQLIPAPLLSKKSGPISDSFQLTISPSSTETVYYTLDGSDPRAPGGAPSSSALAYSGPITVGPDSVVMARAWNGELWGGDPPDDAPWSGLTTGVYHREDLLLTEVQYDPRKPASPSSYLADDFEFIEFYNMGDTTLDLAGYSLGGGIEFSFAGSAVQSLAPGKFVVVVRDIAAFASRYNTSGMNIAGAYSGKLSNGGEEIHLNFYNKLVYEIKYNDTRGWPSAADGGGHSLIPDTHLLDLQGFSRLNYWGNWRASSYIDGSPGGSDPEPSASIIVNEIVAHTDTGNPVPFDSNDTIELYNPTDSNIVLDGFWYLSDDASEPEKWNIPSGTTIIAGGWVSFDEDDFHANRDNVGFGLSKAGERVILSHRPDGGLGVDRIVDSINFSGQGNGDSWGRYPDGSNYFQTLTPTIGSANQLAAIGIQITKLMYNPVTISGIDSDEVLEFIQLTNNSTSTIALEDLVDGSGAWRIDGGVDYRFNSGVTMDAGEQVWLVPFDPTFATESKAFFCANYGLDVNTVRLIGPYSGNLSDSGERIILERPQASDSVEVEDVSWVVVDEATWTNQAPWPVDADGTGLALERIGAVGSAPQSWTTTASASYTDRVTYEKTSQGTINWDSFSLIPNLSGNDYADVNSANTTSVSIVAGTRNTSGGQAGKLLDGFGLTSSNDAANSLFFTSETTTARVLVDLKSVQAVHQLNTYSWHTGLRQNQAYDLYYSAASVAPDSAEGDAADSVALITKGWVLVGTANSDFDTATTGQIGASWSMASAPLNARYFLFDLKAPEAYWCEIDILTGQGFVINGVPKSWLASYGLPTTDQAALLDSDSDGQFNWQEYLAGTNPLDAGSVFKLTEVRKSGAEFLVKWGAVTGKSYTIEYTSDLSEANWTVISSRIKGNAPETSVNIPVSGGKGFVRVRIDTP